MLLLFNINLSTYIYCIKYFNRALSIHPGVVVLFLYFVGVFVDFYMLLRKTNALYKCYINKI